jgi:hypothetical protein
MKISLSLIIFLIVAGSAFMMTISGFIVSLIGENLESRGKKYFKYQKILHYILSIFIIPIIIWGICVLIKHMIIYFIEAREEIEEYKMDRICELEKEYEKNKINIDKY